MNNNLISNRHIRVFISSTFKDMKGEREYLIKRIFPELRAIAEKRDITLTVMDLRWGITDEEVKNGKVIEICLREIDNSVPFFIGIVGNRYGWCPMSSDIGEGVKEKFEKVEDYIKRHLSVTEMEIQHGVLERKDNVHAYFYINKNDTDECSIDYPEKLKKLKYSIRNNKKPDGSSYPVYEYESKEDLGNNVKKSFLSLMDSLFPEKTLAQYDKEYITQTAYKNLLSKTYFHSEKYIRELTHWLNNEEENLLVVTGASGIGKSTTIAYFISQLERNNSDYDFLYYFIGQGNYVSDSIIIEEYLSYLIINKYEKQVELEDSDDINKLLIKLSKASIKLLIIIDGINYLDSYEKSKIMQWLTNENVSTKFIISAEDYASNNILYAGSRTHILKIFPLLRKNKENLISKYLDKYAKKLNDSKVEQLLDLDLCNYPNLLKIILDDLIYFGTHEDIGDRISKYVDCTDANAFFETWINNIENEFGTTLTKLIFSCIFASRNGLNENDLMELCGISPLLLSQFINLIRLQIFQSHGLIKLNDNFSNQFVCRKYLDVDYLVYIRKKIIDYYIDSACDFAYQEVAYQLYKLNEVEKLYNFLKLTDVAYAITVNDKSGFVKYWKFLIESNYSIDVYLSCRNEYLLSNIGSLLTTYFNDPYKTELFYNAYSKLLNENVERFTNTCKEICNEIDGISYGYTEKINPVELMQKGDISYNKGNYDEAISFFLDALKFKDELDLEFIIDIYNRIGSTYDEMQKYDEATFYYRKALYEYKTYNLSIPDLYVETLINFSVSLIHVMPNDAVKCLEEAYIISIENFLESRYAITILMNLGTYMCDYYNNNCKASYYFRKAIDIAEHSCEDDSLLAKLYNNLSNVIEDEETSSDYATKSINLFANLHLFQEIPNLFYKSGIAFEKKKDYFLALSLYTKGYTLAKSCNFTEFAKSISKDIERIKDFLSSYGYNQYLDMDIDQVSTDTDIKEELSKKIAATGCPIANFELSHLYSKKYHGDTEKSLEKLKISSDKGYAKAQYWYANYHLQNDNIDEAIKLLELSSKQNYVPSTYVLGLVYDEISDIDKAIYYYNIAAESYYEAAFNELAFALHKSNKNEEALKWAKLAVESYPEDYNSRDTLGRIYMALSRYDESLMQFKKCLQLQISENIDKTEWIETEDCINKLQQLIEPEN